MKLRAVAYQTKSVLHYKLKLTYVGYYVTAISDQAVAVMCEFFSRLNEMSGVDRKHMIGPECELGNHSGLLLGHRAWWVCVAAQFAVEVRRGRLGVK